MATQNLEYLIKNFGSFVDLDKKSLTISLLSIAFNPTAWNIVARNGKRSRSFFREFWKASTLLWFLFLYEIYGLTYSTLSLSKQNTKIRPSRVSLVGTRAMDVISWLFSSSRLGSWGITCTYIRIWKEKKQERKKELIVRWSGRYHQAILEQPQYPILPKEYATIVPAILFGLGQLFVVTSTWQLGVTGTFLGDYFGILMDHRVEGCVFRFI